jgi:osmotically-inducible protein OsmY
MFKTDLQLKKDVEDELQWDPKVNAARVGVSVQNGAVSLTGEVDSYPEKADAQSIRVDTSGGTVTLSGHASSWAAAHDAVTAAWGAPGVTAVVNDLRISAT